MSYKMPCTAFSNQSIYRHLSLVIPLKTAETSLVEIEIYALKPGDYIYRQLYLKVI